MKIKTYITIGIILFFFCKINTAQSSLSDVIHTQQIYNRLTSPVRMALDKEDNLYVTDNNQKEIIKYDASGNYTESFILNFFPVSIAVSDKNELFIGNKKTGQIFKRSANGDISLFYSGCAFPCEMEFTPDGLLYVVDSKLKQIIVLDASANIVKSFGSDVLIYPTSIAYDGKNKRILVGEHGGLGTGFTPPCKVLVFDLSGTFLSDFGSYGNGDNEFYRISDVSIGKCGNIYVCDPYQGNISVYDENLNFLTKFGSYGNNPGELDVPLDIAFSSEEKILVTTLNNGAVEVYSVVDSLPTSNMICPTSVLCEGGSKDISISFTGTPPWNFTYTNNGTNPITLTTYDNPYILNVTNPGIYEITQLSDAYKSGTCFSGSAVVIKYDIVPTIEISTQTPDICIDDTAKISFNFTGTPPWTFSYSLNSVQGSEITTFDNQFVLNTQNEGKYQIYNFTDNFCTAENNQAVNIVKHEETVPDFSFSTSGQIVEFINLSANADSYFWDFGDGTTSTEINPRHNFPNPGIYTVSLFSSNIGCGANGISEKVNTGSVSANELEKSELITVYPNPTNGKFIIEVKNNEQLDITIEIISLTGKVVYSGFFKRSHYVKEIDLTKVSSGFYTIKIKSKKYTEALKLILSN
ncbi:MAG: T9SS type A sorting domain-containing protein [Bacteroidales bacterium]|nr:T9SS type A sorting domain-containing protein [Bacteroidales bacterium]